MIVEGRMEMGCLRLGKEWQNDGMAGLYKLARPNRSVQEPLVSQDFVKSVWRAPWNPGD